MEWLKENKEIEREWRDRKKMKRKKENEKKEREWRYRKGMKI